MDFKKGDGDRSTSPVIKEFDKMVLDRFLVSGMNDNLSRTNDIYVHFHSHLEKEKFGVGLQTVHLKYL